jgi:hypothetical protein
VACRVSRQWHTDCGFYARKEHIVKDRKGDKQPTKKKDMHGEGNPEADKRYREGLQKFAGSKESSDKAREAAESVEREERGQRSPS